MFQEIDPSDFNSIRHLFENQKHHIPVLAIIDGTYPGRIFVNNINNPGVALAWAIGRWAYIESEFDNMDIGSSLVDLINRIIIPDSLSMSIDWFELYAKTADSWIEKLDNWLNCRNASRHFESVYVWDESIYRHFKSSYIIPEGLTIELVQVPLLPQKLRDTKFVQNHFKLRSTIACNVIADNNVVATCKSNGFEVNNEFMIDIVTYKKHLRGKGFATAAAVGLLDYCLAKNLTPYWETTDDNEASQRLAHKLGFVEKEKYPVLAFEF